MMRPISLRISSITPAPTQGGNITQWRQAIYSAGRSIDIPHDELTKIGSSRFAITVAFYFIHAHFNRADLDNLAKPVLDTLFDNPQSPPTAALLRVDDSMITSLALSKHQVSTPEQEGATITIDCFL